MIRKLLELLTGSGRGRHCDKKTARVRLSTHRRTNGFLHTSSFMVTLFRRHENGYCILSTAKCVYVLSLFLSMLLRFPSYCFRHDKLFFCDRRTQTTYSQQEINNHSSQSSENVQLPRQPCLLSHSCIVWYASFWCTMFPPYLSM